MRGIERLLKKNPNILSIEPEEILQKKGRKTLYGDKITSDFDKLNEIAREFVRKASEIPHWRMKYLEKIYSMGIRTADEFSVTLDEVERLFNEVMFRYVRGGLFGAFITGMYSSIIKRDETIHLDLSNYFSVSGIGYRHSKGCVEIRGDRAYYLGAEAEGGEITVRGNTGNYLGKENGGCRITVYGNTRNWTGKKMKDGFILIKGNAGDILGEKMSGGEIVVEGNAGYWVGDDMTGGIIRIKGDFFLSEDIRGGEIYRWEGRWVRI
ncbi:MAG TPA: hypothetical protein EYP30_06110 [Archaeoglobaceae archaeon]|nr:hypothetical protein [Archaeoglobaceae archaeon]